MKPPSLDQYETMITAAMEAGDWTIANRYATDLDRLEQAGRVMPQLLPAALWYASIGLKVFPLQPGAKTPHRRSHGCKDATTDPDRIRAWWARWPNSNIGVATGHVVDVIDIDGPTGVHSWADLLNDPNGLPPILGAVDTPRPGGTHLYVPAAELGNKAGLFPGIDYRGAGGYVVAPPSVNAEGVAYTWRRPLNLAAVPVERMAVCA